MRYFLRPAAYAALWAAIIAGCGFYMWRGIQAWMLRSPDSVLLLAGVYGILIPACALVVWLVFVRRSVSACFIRSLRVLWRFCQIAVFFFCGRVVFTRCHLALARSGKIMDGRYIVPDALPGEAMVFALDARKIGFAGADERVTVDYCLRQPDGTPYLVWRGTYRFPEGRRSTTIVTKAVPMVSGMAPGIWLFTARCVGFLFVERMVIAETLVDIARGGGIEAVLTSTGEINPAYADQLLD